MAKWFWAGALSIVVVASLVAPTRWRTPLAALAAACALALAWRPRTKAAVQQERYPKQYVARRGTVAPIDGDLEKAVWRLAPWSEPFSEIRGPDAPKGTQPRPEEATRVKMLWDDEYLYIAAVMDVDAGNELVALFKERNSPIFHTDSDFEVFLDPAGCCHGYKELEINALNTVWNLLLDRPYSDGGGEYSGRIAQKGEPRWWDVEKQKTAVKVTKGQIGFAPSKAQWRVEVALRHSESLSQAPQRGAEPSVGSFWRINFSRVEKQGNVNWVWSPQVVWSPAERRYVGQVNMHLPDAWGYVVFADEAGKLHDGSSGEDFRDPGFPARHTAACLYYACRAFREATGRFPALQELRARQMLPDLRDATVQLRSRTDGYVAEVRVGGQRVQVNHLRLMSVLSSA